MPKHILVVEDSLTMQKVIEIALMQENYDLFFSRTFEEAAKLMRLQRPDLVILDAGLAGNSNYALVSQTKALIPRVPVVLLTSYFHPYDDVNGIAVGVDLYMNKPFESQVFIDKISQLLVNTSTYVPSADYAAASTASPTPSGFNSHATLVGIPMPFHVSSPSSVGEPVASALEAPVVDVEMEIEEIVISTPARTQETPISMQENPPIAIQDPFAWPDPAPVERASEKMPAAPVVAVEQEFLSEFNEPSIKIEPVSRAPEGKAEAAPVPHITRAPFLPKAPVPATVLAALERIAARGVEYEAISRLSMEAIEKIVWEVVPDLAEVIIKAEVERVLKQR